MKKILLKVVLLFLPTVFLFAQKPSFIRHYEVTTKDSIVYSIQEFIDTSLVESYNCTFGDSIDYTTRSGFLWLKKRTFREYRIDKKWNEVEHKVANLNIRYCLGVRAPIIMKQLK